MRIHCKMEIHTQQRLSWSQTTFKCTLQTDCEQLRLRLVFYSIQRFSQGFREPGALRIEKSLVNCQPEVTL